MRFLGFLAGLGLCLAGASGAWAVDETWIVYFNARGAAAALDGSETTICKQGGAIKRCPFTAAQLGALARAANLSDLASTATARNNLGLGTAAVKDTGASAGNVVALDGSARLPAVDGSQLTNLPSAGGGLLAANNLSDLASVPAARTNLGLGSAAILATSALAQTANNLSDLANAPAARGNLGLGTVATRDAGIAANNAVVLDGAAKLPAVDGSQLLNLPAAGGGLLAVNNLSDVASVGAARTNLGLGSAALLSSAAVAQTANNLSDLASASAARSNLGLGSAAILASSAVAQTANNLSDLASVGTARSNLGLGSAAILASSAVAQTANNLSDLASIPTARSNLGLGTAATQDTGTTANKVVKLDSLAKLPAIDGSQLINLPGGLTISLSSANGGLTFSPSPFTSGTGTIDLANVTATPGSFFDSVVGGQLHKATVPFSAITGTLNLATQVTGILPAANGGAGSITGALKANGAGLVTQAACGDLSNAAASCAIDATNASNITTGTLPNAQAPSRAKRAYRLFAQAYIGGF